MTLPQQIITIALCALGTQLTRFLPFLIFNEHKKTPLFVQYLGKVLPGAIFSMLIIYCLKNISFTQGNHSLPELIGIAFTKICGEFVTSHWADVGIVPYRISANLYCFTNFNRKADSPRPSTLFSFL